MSDADPDPAPSAPVPAAGHGSVGAWLVQPRASESGGRLVVRYAGGVVLVWVGLAVLGLGVGFATVGSGDNAEAAFAGLGLGVICTFVAWFAANPAIVADRTGIRLFPIFGSRTTFRWDEVRTIGVRDVRAARGRGPALVVEATDDREVKIDSLWVGATRTALRLMMDRLDTFVGTIGVPPPRFVAEQNENTF